MLRVLIVEDEPNVAVMLELIIAPILKEWPNSTITKVRSFAEAEKIINSLPFPDVAIVDLTLPDSSMEQTIKNLSTLNARCPVVIITGHPREALIRLGLPFDAPVVFKNDEINPNVIVNAIARALILYRQTEWDRLETSIHRMKAKVNAV